MFSSKYKNHSARKRKKSAKQASSAFKKTAKLEDKYKGDFEKNSKVSSLDKLKHRKEILTARLEGMEKAAAVKSTSKENEKYFDLMPGSKASTIRPALVAQGGLLRKGLASSGR